MDQDMRNESSPIRPERLMRSISEYKMTMPFFY